MIERSGYCQAMDDEYRARGVDVPVEDTVAVQRERDLQAVAATPEGRRVLGSFVFRYKHVGHAVDGGAALYASGLRQPGQELQTELQRILSRDTFLEILYPKEQTNA